MNLHRLSLALRLSCASNLVGGTLALVAPATLTRLFYGAAHGPTGAALLDHRLLWGFVAILGVCFGIAARAPNEHRALVLAGAIGKLYAAALWLVTFVAGEATPLLLLAVLVDAALGIAFGLGYARMMAPPPTELRAAAPVSEASSRSA